MPSASHTRGSGAGVSIVDAFDAVASRTPAATVVQSGSTSSRGRPLLSAGELHIWRAGVSVAPAGAERCLSAEERTRAARFRFDRDRTSWVSSRVFLRTALGHYAGMDPADVELRAPEGGKPALPCGTVRFSLAHSGDIALCAVARDREVGVDVERVRDGLDVCAIAARTFAPEIARAIASAERPERIERFFAAWTEHEAWTKCLGSGLAQRPGPSSPPVASAAVPAPKGYAAAVAVAGEVGTLELSSVDGALPGVDSSALTIARWR